MVVSFLPAPTATAAAAEERFARVVGTTLLSTAVSSSESIRSDAIDLRVALTIVCTTQRWYTPEVTTGRLRFVRRGNEIFARAI